MHAIKLATLVDLPAIRLLWKTMEAELNVQYPEHTGAYVDQFTRSVAVSLSQESPVVFIFLGAVAGSNLPCAMLVYEIQTRQLGEPHRIGFIHYCYTAPSVRKSGMANALGQMAMEHMAAQGLSHVEITTAPGSPLWADLGFIPFETRCWATVARVTVGLEERTKRANALRSNGLDPDAVPPPVTDEEQDDAL